MRNKYAGDCYKCGCRVEIGTGHFECVRGFGWQVKHAIYPGHGAVTCDMAARNEIEQDDKINQAQVAAYGDVC